MLKSTGSYLHCIEKYTVAKKYTLKIIIAIRERGGSIYMLGTTLLVLRAKTGQGNNCRVLLQPLQKGHG